MADTKTSRRSKRSPLVAKRTTTSGGDMSGATTSSSTSSGSTSTTRHRSNTSEGISVTSAAASDGHQSQDDSETVSINFVSFQILKPIFHWKWASHWLPDANEIYTQKMKCTWPMPEFCVRTQRNLYSTGLHLGFASGKTQILGFASDKNAN